jgi:hypothetical protein
MATVRKLLTIPLAPEDWELIRREAARRGVPMGDLGRTLIAPMVGAVRSREIERTFRPGRAG